MTNKYKIGQEVNWIRCIVPLLTEKRNQNHFYRMLLCLAKKQTNINPKNKTTKQAVVLSPYAGLLLLNFTCAGERAGESPGTRRHLWGLVRTASVSAFTENTRNQLQQCSTLTKGWSQWRSLTQLGRFRYEMTIFKSITMLLLSCTVYGIFSYCMRYVVHKNIHNIKWKKKQSN